MRESSQGGVRSGHVRCWMCVGGPWSCAITHVLRARTAVGAAGNHEPATNATVRRARRTVLRRVYATGDCDLPAGRAVSCRRGHGLATGCVTRCACHGGRYNTSLDFWAAAQIRRGYGLD